jgi:hypothetical protein
VELKNGAFVVNLHHILDRPGLAPNLHAIRCCERFGNAVFANPHRGWANVRKRPTLDRLFAGALTQVG